MPRAPPRLRLLGWLFLLLAVLRLVELAFFVLFALTPWSNPILAGLAQVVLVMVGVDILIAAFLLALAVGLFLGRRGVFQFVLGNMRAPGLLLLLISFFSFIFPSVLLMAIAILSIVVVIAILAVLFSSATRHEVEGMDYARADAGAAAAVVAQRGFRETAKPLDPQDAEEETEYELVEARGWLCRDCDGWNADEATACKHCGVAR